MLRDVLDQHPLSERCTCAHEGDERRTVDITPAVFRGLDELERHGEPAAREPGPLVTLVLSRTVEKVDSIGFEVFRCNQCSAGKS